MSKKGVYVAKIWYDYEGFEILGIYDTKEKAEKALEEPRTFKGDEHEVEFILMNKTDETKQG